MERNLTTRRAVIYSLALAYLFLFAIPRIASACSNQLEMPKSNDVAPLSTNFVTLMSSSPVPPVKTSPHAQVFVGRMLKSATANKQLMLWSMYPASVRGRVFGGEGGSPFSGVGGGW